MSSAIVRQLYREARKHNVGCIVGRSAESALRAARILRQWQVLEDMELVQLRSEWDHDWRPDCSCEDPRCPNKNPESEAFGLIGEFRLPYVDDEGYWQPSEEWHHGGSVWGCVGYRDVTDWRCNDYAIDIMAETIEAFRDAWHRHVNRRKRNRLSA